MFTSALAGMAYRPGGDETEKTWTEVRVSGTPSSVIFQLCVASVSSTVQNQMS